MLGLTTSLIIMISNYFHKYCMHLYVKVSEIWCTSVRSTGLGARQDDHFLYCGRPDFEVNFPSLIVKCM